MNLNNKWYYIRNGIIIFTELQNDKTFDAPKAHRYFVLTYLKENKLDKSKTELLKLLDTIIFIKVNVQKVLY